MTYFRPGKNAAHPLKAVSIASAWQNTAAQASLVPIGKTIQCPIPPSSAHTVTLSIIKYVCFNALQQGTDICRAKLTFPLQKMYRCHNNVGCI